MMREWSPRLLLPVTRRNLLQVMQVCLPLRCGAKILSVRETQSAGEVRGSGVCLEATRSNGFGIEQSGDCVNELVIGISVDRDYEIYRI